jgi:hypothetical protein
MHAPQRKEPGTVPHGPHHALSPEQSVHNHQTLRAFTRIHSSTHVASFVKVCWVCRQRRKVPVARQP